MRLKKAPTYADYEATFARRKKGSDTKPIFRDCQIRLDNDIFTVVRTPRCWESGDTNPVVMWTIDPFNIVTLYADPHNITVRNRLSQAIGRWIFSDLSTHRNKESAVRIAVGDGSSPPYHMGLQVQLADDGEFKHLINPRKDVKILVKKDAVKTVSASTAKLRKLTMTMARLGVYDEPVLERLQNHWSPLRVGKLLHEVNYEDPLGEDADAVFYKGMEIAIVPERSGYIDGVWKQIPIEERKQKYQHNIIENGMKALRKHIYKQTESYERVEV